MSMHHRDMPAAYVHAPYSWVVANATERNAIIDLQEDDLGKLLRQRNDETIWRLKQIGPTVWEQGFGAGGSAITWITNSGVTTGFKGPNNENFAAIVLNPDGSVNLQIVPRRGTLAALTAEAGSAGEISSATDVPAIVKHTGAAGAAANFFPNGTRVFNAAATGSLAASPLAWEPNVGTIRITKDVGVTTITGFGRLNAGYFIGQKVRYINDTTTDQPLYVTQTPLISCPQGGYIDYTWNGTAWKITDFAVMGLTSAANALGSGAFALYGSIQVTGEGAIGLGYGSVAAGNYSYAQMGGQALGVSSSALTKFGYADALNAIALAGEALHTSAVALAGGRAQWQGQVAFGVAGTLTLKAQTSQLLLTGRTNATATPRVLTTNGGNPAATNTPSLTPYGAITWTGIRAFELTVVGRVATAVAAVMYQRKGMIYSDGTTVSLVGTVDTVGTDVNVGVTGSPALSVTLDATFKALYVTATGNATQDIQWVAKLDFTEII